MVEAKAAGQALLAAQPRNPEVLFLASEIAVLEGDVEAAVDWISAAIESAPGQLPLLLKKVNHLLLLRRRSDAYQTAAQAEALAAGNAQDLATVGRLYASQFNDPAKAEPLLQQALSLGEDRTILRFQLAAAQFFNGRTDEAEANLNAIPPTAPQWGRALYLRATLRRQTRERNHIAELASGVLLPFPDPASKAAAYYALAKEQEDVGDFDASFAALSTGAALKRSSLRYDAASELESIRGIQSAYSADALQAIAPGSGGEGAIFIIGMPRTGTTLVERMLGRHTGVKSAGELLDFGQALAAATRRRQLQQPGLSLPELSRQIDFGGLGRSYLAGTRDVADGEPWLIDKMPINFLYAGLIAKAMPEARIIHMTRDPMDSCYAVYKTLFGQAYHFSYNLDELAAYYIAYHRLMRHWHAVLPGAILDVRYEDLVTDFEGQARRVLEFCRMDWEDAVLSPSENAAPSTTASASQVREPVHDRSVNKWRHFASGLEPLRQRLQAAGLVDAAGRALQ
jgi:hypothetical protein